jgi:hypothetical protein
MSFITWFRKAGSTGHVFLFKGGKTHNKGIAYSGLVGPWTTVAVVPTTPQILNFSVDTQTKDRQDVTVTGSVTTIFVPAVAVSKFDFTTDTKTGSCGGDWQEVLRALVIEQIIRAAQLEVQKHVVVDVIRAQKQIEDAIMAELGGKKFSTDGITIVSCSIPTIAPKDRDVTAAIGATERHAMLTEADNALHTRRTRAAQNSRDLQTYEAQTKLALEGERENLLKKQGANKGLEAEADAKATEIRLAPLKNIPAGTLLGAALMTGFERGNVQSLAVTTELLAALGTRSAEKP